MATVPTIGSGHVYRGNPKADWSDEGGLIVKLTNKSGAASVKGKLVIASTAHDDAVALSSVDELMSIGVFYEAGVADGDEVWVVIAGIAEVLLDDNTSATHGNWIEASEAGYADASAGGPGGAHFREIGHALQSVAATGGGTHVLCRIMMHFL